MDKDDILEKTEQFVKNQLLGDTSGHDWWHTSRVVNNALQLAKQEPKADLVVIKLAALLHDVADYKLNGGDINLGPEIARNWLRSLDVSQIIINQVVSIITKMNFKGAKVSSAMDTIEGMIVQDADMLDALGAVGIARVFAFGGYDRREIYNPNIQPVLHDSFDNYKNNKSSSINHFYEKLLLLSDRMNTDLARKVALDRQKFMEDFLKKFFTEWDGNDISM
jgi:uncharacterized protein